MTVATATYIARRGVAGQGGPGVTGLVDRVDHGDGTATLTWRMARPMSPEVSPGFVRLVLERR